MAEVLQAGKQQGTLRQHEAKKYVTALPGMIDWPLILLAIGVLFAGTGYFYFRRCGRYSPADWGSPFKNRLVGLLCRFVYHYHRLTYASIPLPKEGGAIVVSNHVSGLDPLLLAAASPRPLRYLVAREQYDRLGLRWLFRLGNCIPVEREKRPEQAMRAALRAIQDGEVVALFPHGKIHLDTDPPIKIKGGAIRLAQISGCPIFPVRIEGVRGQGHTVLAVFIRSDADIVTHPAVYCRPEHYAENLANLQRLLEARHFDQA
ncbi:MAG TPA: lysophospholipid acyltransferase family protein [Gammaproteobacteria bacterium]